MTKILIFDSGPLINLSMNGLLYILKALKKEFDGKFIITEQVKYEVVDRPIKVPKFELGALQIKELISNNILELPSSIGINSDIIKKETLLLMKKINTCMIAGDRQINLVSEAEISCLAVSAELAKRNIENIIAIDERTTRILTENPKELEKLMSNRLHIRVDLKCDISMFKDFRFIRSTELVYVAFKKNILNVKGPQVLEAALYATKFKGSSVSFKEISVLKKL